MFQEMKGKPCCRVFLSRVNILKWTAVYAATGICQHRASRVTDRERDICQFARYLLGGEEIPRGV